MPLRMRFFKLNPFTLIKNPVIFIVEAGAILTTILVFREMAEGSYQVFNLQVAIWLWFTVFLANFSEAIAEGRGGAESRIPEKKPD